MGKNITSDIEEQIIEILDIISPKLTWDILVDEINIRLNLKYTRQGLCQNFSIKNAYDIRKKYLKEYNKKSVPQYSGINQLLGKIERLEAEKYRLQEQNAQLLQQFVIWSYNAYLHNVSEDQLNAPIPPIDRGKDD